MEHVVLEPLRIMGINIHFYNVEGVKNADEGKFKEAAECFTNAIKLSPKDSLSYFNRATVKISMGDITGARSDFELSENFQSS